MNAGMEFSADNKSDLELAAMGLFETKYFSHAKDSG